MSDFVCPDGAVRVALFGGRGYFLIDTADLEYVQLYNWHLNDSGYVNRRVSRSKRVREHKILLHRELLGLTTFVEGVIVDHINGDILDNRRSNLRVTDKTGNSRNARVYKNNAVGYKGVGRESYGRPWRARITVNKKTLYLGAYDTPEEAARAYDAAALEHFGAHARLNFP